MAAFRAAIEQKYQIIETDPGVTRDGVIILMHDKTVNRTCRTAAGERIEMPLANEDLTYDEMRDLDAGIGMDQSFRGEKVPRLSDLLLLAKENNVFVKLDNKSFELGSRALSTIFREVRQSGADATVTCQSALQVRRVLAELPGAPIHYDGPVDEETLRTLHGLCAGRELVVWLPLKCKLTDWVKVAFASEELAALVHKYARLGLWILSEESEYKEALALGADVIETTGGVKPR